MFFFQEVKEMLVNRRYAEIDSKVFQLFFDEVYNVIRGYQFGEELPQDLLELREWIYQRVAKDIIYQDGSYLNDHFCIGVIYGILRVMDDQTDCGDMWYNTFNEILNKE